MIRDNVSYSQLVSYLSTIFNGNVPEEAHIFFAHEGVPTRAVCYSKMGNLSGWSELEIFDVLLHDVKNYVASPGGSS